MDIVLIWVSGEEKYFCERDWTANSLICPSGKSVDLSAVTSTSQIIPSIERELREPQQFAYGCVSLYFCNRRLLIV